MGDSYMSVGFWAANKAVLASLFHQPSDAFPIRSPEYDELQEFIPKLLQHQAHAHARSQLRRAGISGGAGDAGGGSASGGISTFSEKAAQALGLPVSYDRRYRVNVAVLTQHEGRMRALGRDSPLTEGHVAEYRRMLRVYEDFLQKRSLAKLRKLREDQAKLPVNAHREEIVAAVAASQVTVIAGDTGCGKFLPLVPSLHTCLYSLTSYRSSPFSSPPLLSAPFFFPSALSLPSLRCPLSHRRVAFESLNEYGAGVAYRIRFQSTATAASRILFLTEVPPACTSPSPLAHQPAPLPSHPFPTCRFASLIFNFVSLPRLFCRVCMYDTHDMRGVLLRELLSDPLLTAYSVIIVDEVHERHVTTDMLLALLKQVVQQRMDLRVILMSATINVHTYSAYFHNAPIVTVPGRTYPITIEHLPQPAGETGLAVPPPATAHTSTTNCNPTAAPDAVNATAGGTVAGVGLRRAGGGGGAGRVGREGRVGSAAYVRVLERIDQQFPADQRGDLLVFLSGIQEISAVAAAVQQYAQESKRWLVLLLHSSLSSKEQDKVFAVAPAGVRKCILSTNIAETSVTIDGVRFVVDSGKEKAVTHLAEIAGSTLQEQWVSQFRQFSIPELLRVPLESVVLQMKMLSPACSLSHFGFLDAPSPSALHRAVLSLTHHGALAPPAAAPPLTTTGAPQEPEAGGGWAGEEDKRGAGLRSGGDNGSVAGDGNGGGGSGGDDELVVTPLGHVLAGLPVDIPLGKMLVLGSLFPPIAPLIALLAAALAVPSPFVRVPEGEQGEKIRTAQHQLRSGDGDAFTLMAVFGEWSKVQKESSRAAHRWCKRHGVEPQRLMEMAKLHRQFTHILLSTRLLRSTAQRRQQMQQGRKRGRWDREGSESGEGGLGGDRRGARHSRWDWDERRQQLMQVQRMRQARERGQKQLRLRVHSNHEEEDDDEGGGSGEEEIAGGDAGGGGQQEGVDEGYGGMGEEDLEGLELRLSVDMDRVASLANKELTRGDIHLIKFIVCAALYPNIAIADAHNGMRRESDQFFHTRHVSSACIHPCSSLCGSDAPITASELLVYGTLLETTKLYLSNLMRIPSLPALLLTSLSIDASSDGTRILFDDWLLVRLTPLPMDEARRLLVGAGEERQGMEEEEERTEGEEEEGGADTQVKELADRIATFLQSPVPFSCRQLTPMAAAALLSHAAAAAAPGNSGTHDCTHNVAGAGFGSTKTREGQRSSSGKAHSGVAENASVGLGSVQGAGGSAAVATAAALVEEAEAALRAAEASKSGKPIIKGGVLVTPFLRIGSIPSHETNVATQASLHMRSHWQCPLCCYKLILTLPETVDHLRACGNLPRQPQHQPGTTVTSAAAAAAAAAAATAAAAAAAAAAATAAAAAAAGTVEGGGERLDELMIAGEVLEKAVSEGDGGDGKAAVGRRQTEPRCAAASPVGLIEPRSNVALCSSHALPVLLPMGASAPLLSPPPHSVNFEYTAPSAARPPSPVAASSAYAAVAALSGTVGSSKGGEAGESWEESDGAEDDEDALAVGGAEEEEEEEGDYSEGDSDYSEGALAAAMQEEAVVTGRTSGACQTGMLSGVAHMAMELRTPIVYYRPDGPSRYLKVYVYHARAMPAVAKALVEAAEKGLMASEGLQWPRGSEPMEDNIKSTPTSSHRAPHVSHLSPPRCCFLPLSRPDQLPMRFLAETSLAGGAWCVLHAPHILPLRASAAAPAPAPAPPPLLYISPAPPQSALSSVPLPTADSHPPASYQHGSTATALPSRLPPLAHCPHCGVDMTARLGGTNTAQHPFADSSTTCAPAGNSPLSVLPPLARVSRCAVECVSSWRSLQSLSPNVLSTLGSPDATQGAEQLRTGKESAGCAVKAAATRDAREGEFCPATTAGGSTGGVGGMGGLADRSVLQLAPMVVLCMHVVTGAGGRVAAGAAGGDVGGRKGENGRRGGVGRFGAGSGLGRGGESRVKRGRELGEERRGGDGDEGVLQVKRRRETVVEVALAGREEGGGAGETRGEGSEERLEKSATARGLFGASAGEGSNTDEAGMSSESPPAGTKAEGVGTGSQGAGANVWWRPHAGGATASARGRAGGGSMRLGGRGGSPLPPPHRSPLPSPLPAPPAPSPGDIESLGLMLGGGTTQASRDPILAIAHVISGTSGAAGGAVDGRNAAASEGCEGIYAAREPEGTEAEWCREGYEGVGFMSSEMYGWGLQREQERVRERRQEREREQVLGGREEVRVYRSEREMLKQWRRFFVFELDPDVVVVFQARDSWQVLKERWAALGLGDLDVGRRGDGEEEEEGETGEEREAEGTGVHRATARAEEEGQGGRAGGGKRRASKGSGPGGGGRGGENEKQRGRGLVVRGVVTYGKQWVRQQLRMSATSNQETFQVRVEGRCMLDLLRAILTSQALSTFSLHESCQVFVGRPLELLSPACIAAMWGGGLGGRPRLLRYAAEYAKVVHLLLQSQRTLVETVEMARVTGLLLSDVQYRAQMARVHSLLLRTAGPHGWLLGGADPSGQLTQSPFLLHPKEACTAGLYRSEPVAVLDFASLYPSLFVAYNLCCSSLVHPGDRHRVPEEHVFVSPTGAAFTRASLHRGVLPRICAALIAARKDTQRRLSTPPHAPRTAQVATGAMGAEAAMSAEERAALDGRQRALKLCANALYGFTGSNASPLRTVAVADSCLGLGAAACMHAKDAATQIFPGACRVIYGQTDSIFVLFPEKTPAEAAAMGAELAARLSELFPAPMAVKLERVLCPFMLLQVNRYAGRQVFPVPSPPPPAPPAQRTAPHQHQGSTPAAAAAAQEEEEKDMSLLLVKGIETDRRDVPLFVRATCRAVIRRILLDGDVAAAAREARAAVVRLMTGGCSMFELIMTGGLWRVNDSDLSAIAEQTAAASAAAAGRASRGLDSPQRSEAAAGGGAGREGAGPATAEEGRGPHVALAARLKARDPDRRFLIGERIPYILLDNGARLQDDMAEEPLLALLSQLPPNAAVYARNKLQKPLSSGSRAAAICNDDFLQEAGNMPRVQGAIAAQLTPSLL
ncbi:unnamed protein product [Closterium sp. NIES-65]|nr:unnamed protein product [Closterium sp. NIES-65]